VLIFLNGRLVPEDRAVVSVFDRGFLYGDGLFETLLVRNGKPFRWPQHLDRLRRGAAFLNIKLPFPPRTLLAVAGRLLVRNKTSDAILRLTLSRGPGVRGYSPAGAKRPTLVMSLHPLPLPPAPTARPRGKSAGRKTGGEESLPRWKLITATLRLPANDPLARFKTNNKLAQILARAEAEAARADEALLRDTDGHVVEGAGSNLFWIERGVVCTPPLGAGILPGITRALVLEVSRSLGLKTAERHITLPRLKKTGGIFLSLTSYGTVLARSLDGQTLQPSPLVAAIHRAVWAVIRAETG
jgi:branched-subunit amino acid aminotransferase/4-amino-4-deoxychorismate lyase